MGDRVIFLDIDGVLIPSSMFMLDREEEGGIEGSYKDKGDGLASVRLSLSVTCVACLRHLCLETGAKIVTNTTHNTRFGDNLLPSLNAVGLGEFVIGHTAYPSGGSRDEVVKRWLAEHPEVTEWIAFDDAKFTDNERLVWCDSNCGIGVREMNAGLDLFGHKPVLIFM